MLLLMHYSQMAEFTGNEKLMCLHSSHVHLVFTGVWVLKSNFLLLNGAWTVAVRTNLGI